jgi:hypothetical protein
MLRHLMRFALALSALVALSGCAIERLTGPQVDVASGDRTAVAASPRREDDPRDVPADPGGLVGSAADSLRTGDEDR